MPESGSGFYAAEVARIHDRDFGHIARAAAATAIADLRRLGHESGLIVDLGCGSGIASAAFVNAGFDVVGIDSSADMIDLARAGCPRGTFSCESIYNASLPPAAAVIAAGEVFNYRNVGNPAAQLLGLLRRINDSLLPGGFLLFDVAAPGRAGATAAHQEVRLDDDRTMTVDVLEASSELTRTVTLTGSTGTETETHSLHLWSDTKVAEMLQTAGFREPTTTSYLDLAFNTGWSTWIAYKAT